MADHPHRRSSLRLRIGALSAAIALAALVVAACSGTGTSPAPAAGSSVVVTTPVLGAVVRDLVGDEAEIVVLMGNGVDPHDWSPSAKDIERPPTYAASGSRSVTSSTFRSRSSGSTSRTTSSPTTP